MSRVYIAIVACIALMTAGRTFGADAAADDALKSNGLAMSGSAYVLNDEADLLKEMPTLRKTKKDFDADSRIRTALEARIKAQKTIITQGVKEHEQLKDRLSVVTDAGAHNRLVLRMNQIVIKLHDADASRKEAEELLAKRDTALGTKYTDDVIALDAKAQETTKKYEQLAGDPAVKAAVLKASRGANSQVKLGPGPDFAAAVAELAKCRSEIEAEAIPLTEEHGVQSVTVLLNGEPFKMMIDSGASFVTLPREIAEKLHIIPGPQDPTLTLKMADGHAIQVQQMSLKTVRVGRFTLENVTCAVMPPGPTDAPAMLGNSFLSHFIVKLDQKAGQLRLIDVEQADKQSAPTGKITVIGKKPPEN